MVSKRKDFVFEYSEYKKAPQEREGLRTYKVTFESDTGELYSRFVYATGEEEAANNAADSMVARHLEDYYHDYYELADCTDSDETVDMYAQRNGISKLGDNGFYFKVVSIESGNNIESIKKDSKICIIEQIFSSEKHYIRNIVQAATRDKISLEKFNNEEDSLSYYVMDTIEAIDEYNGMYDSDIVDDLVSIKDSIEENVAKQNQERIPLDEIINSLIKDLDNVISLLNTTK